MTTLRLITRKSPLALWQANFIKAQLEDQHPELTVTLQGVTTDGDRWLETPLYHMGGKGLFVKALEEAILDGEADFAVHSIKDMPAQLPNGLQIGAITEREDPRDAWVSVHYPDPSKLPPGAKVGTSSLRRAAQFLHKWPEAKCLPLRGNVGTRLEKCLSGEYDGIILAAAGLIRLEKADYIQTYFEPEILLPAIGQGALGIECRRGDDKTLHYLKTLNHYPTAQAVTAERRMSAILGGGCHTPLAGYATVEGSQLSLSARVASITGETLIAATAKGELTDPVALGEQLANALRLQGADTLIQAAGENS